MLRSLRSLVRDIFRRSRFEREMADELQFHIERRTADLVASGLSPEEARRRARVEFGGLERYREECRHARGLQLVDQFRGDLRYAVRTFARAPGFTFVAVFTLALGIGSVTLTYSVVHNVLIDPLPYRDSDRLVNVLIHDTQTGRSRPILSVPEFLDYQEQSRVFEDVIATMGVSVRYATSDSIEYLRAVWVTPNFFDFMGLSPLVGRAIAPADGQGDAPPVAVLRYRAWVSYFNRDPDVVGKTVLLNGEPRTIVGVMPPRFTWHAADLWIPKPLDRSAPDAARTFRNFQARLRDDVNLEEAEAQLNAIAARRAREHPQDYPEKFRIRVVNVIAYTVGTFSGVLYTALAAVALLMLIACCNVANMLLARATTREREMTVRAALGAGRGRIVRQLLAESLLLALAGAAAGCLLASIGIDTLIALLPQSPLPGEIEIGLNRPVLAFSLGTAVLCTLVFGLAPALYSARRDLADSLKSGGRGAIEGRSRLRNALVAAEIALSLVLLLSAGLLVRSFASLMRVDLGFDTRNVLVAFLGFPPGEYATALEKQRFYQRALERIASLPGVESAAATTNLPPFGGGFESDLEIFDERRTSGDAIVQLCTPDYFRTLGIRSVRGRGLPESRAGEMPRAAVVNRTFVARFFEAEDPLGRQVKLISAAKQSDSPWDGVVEIVGVAEDVRNRGLLEPAAPQVYLSGSITARVTPALVVRTTTHPGRSIDPIRRAIASVDNQVALRQPGTMEEALDRSLYAQPRFSLIVLGVFALTGTLLVAIGVFSVIAYSVSRQTREIAVRMALGAGRKDVSCVVLRQGVRLLGAGIAAGLLGTFATGRLLANQLWNVSPHDPLTVAAATCAIAVVALAACCVPALRATRIEPMTALRND